MIEPLESGPQIPGQLKLLLSDAIFPLSMAYFVADNDALNFSCKISNISNYAPTNTYSVYAIYPLLRLLVTKTNVMEDEVTRDVFQGYSDYLTFILQWDKVKKVILFDMSKAEYFQDQTLIKELNKNRDVIIDLIQNETEI